MLLSLSVCVFLESMKKRTSRDLFLSLVSSFDWPNGANSEKYQVTDSDPLRTRTMTLFIHKKDKEAR